jgi:hypothetical protein
VEALAAFEAWAHSEANLNNRDMAQYTDQELNRLQLGWAIRERGASSGHAESSVQKRKRELRRGHREARREEFADLGFQ